MTRYIIAFTVIALIVASVAYQLLSTQRDASGKIILAPLKNAFGSAGPMTLGLPAPEPILTDLPMNIEQRVLGLVIWLEDRSSKLENSERIAWTIVNRVQDPRRRNVYYRTNITDTVLVPHQITSVTQKYKRVIRHMRQGQMLDYIPDSVRAGGPDARAWRDCQDLAKAMLLGNLDRSTTATHYLSLKALRGQALPTWAADYAIVGGSGHHLLLQDYGYLQSGKRIVFTKERPYDDSIHYLTVADIPI